MTTHHVITLALCLLLPAGLTSAGAIDDQAIGQMPVKEVTVFKDGHAFVLHEGRMSTDAGGNVVLDYLPVPVIGTFWAYADDEAATLAGVVAGTRVVSVERTALTVAEMIEANVGQAALITEHGGEPYAATIVAIPARSSDEFEAASPPGTPPALPVKAAVVLLRVADGGTKAVPLGRIQEVTFTGAFKPRFTSNEFRNMMTLKLDWGERKAAETANVGMAYVQRGLRWIPNYRVEIDGEGNATLSLQATLVNELADLDNVTAHLVIGVPTFAFKDTPDPISMQDTVARLSSVMQPTNQTAYAFSNAIMSQRVAYQPRRAPAEQPSGPTINLGSDVAAGDKQEDLYVFTVNNITLKKGERMTVPISTVTLAYKDVFVLDLPFGPPPEARASLNNQQQAELARLFHAPKAMHVLRLANTADVPLTTAPALIVRDGRVMAQGMMQYTAVGASCDLTMTTAVDVGVKVSDNETGREANAHTWHGKSYDRINLTGAIHLTNHCDETIALEVRRSVLGFVDSASQEGEVNQLGRHESGWARPQWWHWYGWPSWWHHVNSVGQVSWTFDLKADESIDLGYEWHYFWRW